MCLINLSFFIGDVSSSMTFDPLSVCPEASCLYPFRHLPPLHCDEIRTQKGLKSPVCSQHEVNQTPPVGIRGRETSAYPDCVLITFIPASSCKTAGSSLCLRRFMIQHSDLWPPSLYFSGDFPRKPAQGLLLWSEFGSFLINSHPAATERIRGSETASAVKPEVMFKRKVRKDQLKRK